MSQSDADKLRLAYAHHLLAYDGISDNAALRDAFAAVKREKFLGPPPFRMLGFGWRAVRVSPEDLDHVYRDVLFVLDADKGINNGEPSLHALLINALAPKPGDRVVHIGTGAGYYTAILAELVGPAGHVLAVEVDARLGDMARANLSDRANVAVVASDGAEYPRDPADCIYVNFAVAAPAARWLEKLAPGGRLIFPLGVPDSGERGPRHAIRGAMFRIQRVGEGFSAKMICPASFIFGVAAAGETDPDEVAQLGRAFALRGARKVKSLIWRKSADPERCWFHSEAWSLSYDPPDAD